MATFLTMDLWGSWEKERISEKPSPVPAPWQRVNIHGKTVGLKAVLRMGFFIHSWRWAGRGGKVRLVYLKAKGEMKVWTLESMPGQGQASSVVAFWLLYNHQIYEVHGMVLSVFFFQVLETELWASHVLGMRSTTELCPLPGPLQRNGSWNWTPTNMWLTAFWMVLASQVLCTHS